jgi:hypothetical protein
MTSEPLTGVVYGEEPARERTRAFLLQEAARPLAEILASVVLAHTAFEASLQGVSAAQAAFHPPGVGEDAFSIAQIARHVAGSGAIMAERLRAIGLGEQPTRTTSPGNFGDLTAESLPALMEPLRAVPASLQASVAAITGRERLDSTTRHPMFGELNWRAYLRLIGLHVEDHIRQVEQIKASAGYPRARGSAAATAAGRSFAHGGSRSHAWPAPMTREGPLLVGTPRLGHQKDKSGLPCRLPWRLPFWKLQLGIVCCRQGHLVGQHDLAALPTGLHDGQTNL